MRTRMVPCPHRGDHKIRNGHMHGPSQCPPVPGEHGEHKRRKRLRHQKSLHEAEFATKRGEAVAGTGKPSASSGEKAGVKTKKGILE